MRVQQELRRSTEFLVDRCTAQFEKMVRPSDELHDYFFSSLQIIQRIAQSLCARPTESADALYRRVQQHELVRLAEFFDQEIAVAAERAKRWPLVVDVTQSGLSADGKIDNRPALEELLDALRSKLPGVALVFPAGRYRFSAAPIPGSEPRRAAICLQDVDGLTIVGQGRVTFIVDGATGPGSIYVENCRDIQVRNLTLDMDPLPFTTGTVVGADPGSSTFELELTAGERPADEPFFRNSGILRGKLHDPETGRLYRQEGDLRVIDVAKVGRCRYRLRVARNDLSSPPGLTAAFRPGLLFCLHARSDGYSRGNGIEVFQSRHVLFRDLRLYGVGLHGVVVRASGGIQFLDCAIEPAPGRLALNTADAFHVPGNYKGLYLERCTVDRSNDDCLNFYTKAHSVLVVERPRTVSILQARVDSFCVGDLVALIDANNGQVDAVSSLRSVRTGEWRGSPCLELEWAEPLPDLKIHSRDSTGRGIIRPREYVPSGGQIYRVAMDIDAPFEHLVVNLSLKNDGFVVRNCQMGHNRATGFKCKASNGIVENWRLGGGMSAGLGLKIGLDWKEGFYPHNILLDNCRLGTRVPIAVFGGLPGGRTLAAENMPWIRDIEARNIWDEYGKEPICLPTPIKDVSRGEKEVP